MRTEIITAGDGRSVHLAVPPLPGQCWEAMRIESATARSGAALGLLLAAGGVFTPDKAKGRPWRPTPLHRHRGDMASWGYSVFNAVSSHTGWDALVVSSLADSAFVLMADEVLSGEDIESARGFFSAPFLQRGQGEE
jgi:hypothetical protein